MTKTTSHNNRQDQACQAQSNSQNLATTLPKPLIDRAIAEALREDLGLAGDITTNGTINSCSLATCQIKARQPGVIAGLPLAQAAFLALSPAPVFTAHIADGDRVTAGMLIADIKGNARSILSAERVALNFLGHMSGIATLTQRYADAVKDTNAAIVDTRKTTPGLRAFEKYAVKAGGGQNHRSGLFDAVLIKDNHIAVAGGIDAAITAARNHVGHLVKIEVEIDTLEQLQAALHHKIDAVLLDNMSPHILRKAVAMVAGRIITEASGGVTLDTVHAIAQSGVNLISIGALTHSAPVLDLGLDYRKIGH